MVLAEQIKEIEQRREALERCLDIDQKRIDLRRPGDIAECYADPTKAKNELGWVAGCGIEEMCADSWNWQKNNPDGYHTVK